jgi:hypothetical protein
MHRVTAWVVGFVALLGALYYFFVHRPMRSNARPRATP